MADGEGRNNREDRWQAKIGGRRWRAGITKWESRDECEGGNWVLQPLLSVSDLAFPVRRFHQLI